MRVPAARASIARMGKLGVLVAAAVLAGCGASEDAGKAGVSTAEALRLTLATPDLALYDNVGLKAFVDAAKRRSGGRLEVVPELVDRLEVVGEVRAGRHDLGWEPLLEIDPEATPFAVANLPFLVDSYALQRRLFEDGDWPERLLQGLEGTGLAGVAMLAGELGRPMAPAPGLRTPADWRGLDLHSAAGPHRGLRARVLEALGVREVVTTEAAGFVDLVPEGLDAVEATAISVEQNGLGAYGHVVTLDAAAFSRPVAVFADPERLERLTDEQQGWLRAAAQDAQEASLEMGERDEERFAKACGTSALRGTLAGAEANAALRAEVLAVARPAAAELIDLVERTRREVEPERAVVPAACSAAPAAVALPVLRDRDSAELEGTYRFELTEADLARTKAEPVQQEDFSGTWTMRFREGAFSAELREGSSVGEGKDLVTDQGVRADGGRASFVGPGPPLTLRYERLPGGDLRWRPTGAIDPVNGAAFAERWRRVR